MKSLVIYNGPSAYDGKPIVAIIQRSSKNTKTGNLAQLWILSAEHDPITASRTGEDYAVCGNCKHRGKAAPNKSTGWASERACYVNLVHGPLAVYKAWERGVYKRAKTIGDVQALLSGQTLRLGAYGDPGALPDGMIGLLVQMSDGHTGYTHSQTAFNDSHAIEKIARHVMLSADSKAEAMHAHGRGFRTFRVIPIAAWKANGKAELLSNEIICPASKEAGNKTTCGECKLCGGSSQKAKSIAIVAHGTGAKHHTGE